MPRRQNMRDVNSGRVKIATGTESPLYLGIDLGTSGVKVIAMDEGNAVTGEAAAALGISRPGPLMSEQDPADWWAAVDAAVLQLGSGIRASIAAIGLTGQMHGAVPLDAAGEVLRPAILWNDGRSHAECAEMEAMVPDLADITGNRAMPGFTAPKLLWLRKHEPDLFERTAKILLPKDWLRYRMSGAMVSDMSDAAGTLWLNVGRRTWSDDTLSACGLTRDHMPDLAEGGAVSAYLSSELAAHWGMTAGMPIAAGGGDNAAGAVGAGIVGPGETMLSIGTSGVIFHVDADYRPNPAGGVHTFCHALPGLWHQMSVMLSAASAIDWAARVTGFGNAEALHSAAEARGRVTDGEIFLPYLSGERTPHNDPHATGAFFGLTHDTDAAALAQAALEGVALAYRDGADAIAATGNEISELTVIGGGSRSRYFGEVLAAALEKPLVYRNGADRGPAYGAARLARLAAGDHAAEVLTAPDVVRRVEPDAGMAAALKPKHERFKQLYKHSRKAMGDGS